MGTKLGRRARRLERGVPRPIRALLIVFAVTLATAAAVYLPSQLSSSTGSAPAETTPSIRAVDLERQTIYESPQEPGYTAWVGAWIMPDDSLMTAFVQATGSVDPSQRDLAPARVLDAFGTSERDVNRDFWGLDLELKYLRSTDGGASWQPFRSDPFQAIIPHGYIPQATIALEDGTILRRINGDDLRHDPSVPHTAYLQRLGPDATTWSRPQVLLDPDEFTYQISRLRSLDDGRLIATGNYWEVPADTRPSEREDVPSRFLLMTSSDGGESWEHALTIPPEAEYLPGLEWDTAELPDGDLLAVMRTLDSPTTETEVRKQAILEKDGDGWVLTELEDAPLAPSGHPELLETEEGPILHIATSGVHYTTDGRTWTRLAFPGGHEYASNYYPRAVQTDDGVVHVFSHVGGDDDYGEVDQSITLDTFQLTIEPPSGSG